MHFTNFFAAVAAVAPLASAASYPTYPTYPTYSTVPTYPTGPSRCANHQPPPRLVDQISRLAGDDNTFGRINALEQGVDKCHRTIKIQTWIHAAVAANSSATHIDNAAMQKQLDVLNAAFLPHDVMFVKAGFTRVQSNSLANFTYDYGEDGISGSPNPDIEEYWKEYRTGDYQTLHIWLYDNMSDGLLGIATFPDIDRPESEKWLDGVHADANSVPGGSTTNYDLGITVVHEVGHWLGLFHVFSDEGICGGDGDLVDDTPAQSDPTSGCPADNTKDSCPDIPGFDSIHNYMDYSWDSCLTEFTEGQENRVHNVWKTIRSAVVW